MAPGNKRWHHAADISTPNKKYTNTTRRFYNQFAKNKTLMHKSIGIFLWDKVTVDVVGGVCGIYGYRRE